MIQLARTMLSGLPVQTIAVIKAYQVSATQVFVIFRRKGQIYGDIFTASGAEIDTVTREVEPGENNYLQATIISGADANADPDITAATIVDQTRPVITLLGNNPDSVAMGNPYTDPGATASDDIDGDLSSSIVIDVSNLDVDTEGEYTITYNVTDSTGNAAVPVTRIVQVVD